MFKGLKILPGWISFLSQYNPVTYATFGNIREREKGKETNKQRTWCNPSPVDVRSLHSSESKEALFVRTLHDMESGKFIDTFIVHAAP
jgi:hypothetical protein